MQTVDVTGERLVAEAAPLLQRLIACDTTNPPGAEAQAVALLEELLSSAGLECERVEKDPQRPNLLARLRGDGSGPSLAFLGHLDVVPACRDDWSVEPFAGIVRDGAIWGRGAVDMKSQVAAVAIALATLARQGFRPGGDLMLVLMADEEVGDAGVGAPFFVEARPDLRPDFVVGEGAGERIPTPAGPIYLLDRGVKRSAHATLRVRGRPADASLPDSGASALLELARLLLRLDAHRSPLSVPPELEELLDVLAGTEGGDEQRVAAARAAHPALDALVGALVGNVVRPTTAEATGPANVVPREATATLQCVLLPEVTQADLERELRDALGPGDYELEVSEPQGGHVSAPESLLRDAIEGFLAEHDPEAQLVPALGYGYSDCDSFRQAYGSTVYGFIPFRHADPLVNLSTKHGGDERVLLADLRFQAECALAVATEIGSARF